MKFKFNTISSFSEILPFYGSMDKWCKLATMLDRKSNKIWQDCKEIMSLYIHRKVISPKDVIDADFLLKWGVEFYELFKIEKAVLEKEKQLKYFLKFLQNIKHPKMLRIDELQILLDQQQLLKYTFKNLKPSIKLSRTMIKNCNKIVKVLRSDPFEQITNIATYVMLPWPDLDIIPLELNEIVFELNTETLYEVKRSLRRYREVKIKRVKILIKTQILDATFLDIINDINYLNLISIQIIFINSIFDWKTAGFIIWYSAKFQWEYFEIWWAGESDDLNNFQLNVKNQVGLEWNRIHCNDTVVSIWLPKTKEVAYFSIIELCLEHKVEKDYFSVSESGIQIFFPSCFQLKLNRILPQTIPLEIIRGNEFILNNFIGKNISNYLYLHNSSIDKWIYDWRTDIANFPPNLSSIKLVNFDLSRDYTEGFLIKYLPSKTVSSIHWILNPNSEIESLRKGLELFNSINIREFIIEYKEIIDSKRLIELIEPIFQFKNIKKIIIKKLWASWKKYKIHSLNLSKNHKEVKIKCKENILNQIITKFWIDRKYWKNATWSMITTLI